MKSISISYIVENQVLRAEKTPSSRETEMAQMSMLSEVEVWLSVDSLAEDYPGWSPYNYTLLNPVKLVDPDGRSVYWKPIIYDDGAISYQKEKGDNETTLKSQYGLSSDAAHALYSNMENGEISGKTVQEVTGNKILKLNLDSYKTSDQRVIDQALFAMRDYHRLNEKCQCWDPEKYFSNVTNRQISLYVYKGKVNLSGVTSDIAIRMYWRGDQGAYFKVQEYSAFYSSQISKISQGLGNMFGSFQPLTTFYVNSGFKIGGKRTWVNYGGTMWLTVRRNTAPIFRRYLTQFNN